jgi:hypothetical protein
VIRSLAAASTLVALWLLWESVPRAALAGTRPEAPVVSPASPAERPDEPRPDRDLFAFAGPVLASAPVSPPTPSEPLPAEPLVSEPPVPSVRLLGLMREGDRVRALLLVDGETALLAVGESLRGYRVAAVDEDAVRLRQPDGTEVSIERPD